MNQPHPHRWMRKLSPILLLSVIFLFQMFSGCQDLLNDWRNPKIEEDDVSDVELFVRPESANVKPTTINEDMVSIKDRQAKKSGIEYIEPKLVGAKHAYYGEKPPFYQSLIKDSDTLIDVNLDMLNGVTIPELITIFADPSILNFQYSIDKAIAGSVSIQLSAKMKKSEAWKLLERLIWMNQAYLSYQDGIVWIRPLIDMMTDPDLKMDTPSSTNVSVRVFRLKTVEAKSVIESLKPFLSKGGFITEIQGHNALLIIDTDNNLKKLKDIIDTVDQVSDTDWYRALFPVENMSPSRLNYELEQILQVLGFPVASTSTTGTKTSTSSSASNAKFGAIRMVPMDRIQAILVMAATKEAVEEVAQWVRLLDANDHAGQEQIYVYNVINGRATELGSELAHMFAIEVATIDALSNTLSSTSSEDGGGGGAPKMSGSGGTGAVRANTASTSSSSSATRRQQDEANQAGSASVFTIPCKMVANDEQNRMTFLATPQVYAMIKAVLDRIDTVPQQVILQVVVAEITLKDGENLGSSFDIKAGASRVVTQYDNMYTSPTTTTNEDGSTTTTGGTFPNGFGYLLQSDDNKLFFKALATKGRVEVLAKPTILVRTNKTARVNVGTKEPYTTGTQTDGTGSYSTVMNSQIDYEQVGVILTVTPTVTRGGLIQLLFKQEVSQVAKSTVETTSSQMSPAFMNRTIETSMSLRDGAFMIVGGLIQTNKESSVQALPLLANIPVMRFLGGTTTRNETRTELVVMVTARIVNAETPLEETIRGYTNAIDMVRREKKANDKKFMETEERKKLHEEMGTETVAIPPAANDKAIINVNNSTKLEELGVSNADRKQAFRTMTSAGTPVTISVEDKPKETP